MSKMYYFRLRVYFYEVYLAIRIFYGRVPKNAILVGFYYESSMILYKVEVGSAMYKEGFRWTESINIHGKTGISQCMVLDYILTISLASYLRCWVKGTATRTHRWTTKTRTSSATMRWFLGGLAGMR